MCTYCFLFAQLYVSRDLGETWVHLGNGVGRYNWRVLDAEYESNTTLYFERNLNGLCVCVCLRERERERHGWYKCQWCVCVLLCVCERERESERVLYAVTHSQKMIKRYVLLLHNWSCSHFLPLAHAYSTWLYSPNSQLLHHNYTHRCPKFTFN